MSGPYAADDMLVVLGFTVDFGGGSGQDADSAWETCSGGSLNIEIAEASVGSDQYHQTTPGHKYVDDLTLRGPLTSGRQSMGQWITDVLGGKEWKRQVTIKEILKDGSDGKSYTYSDCFPTRYVFPAFAASGTGNLYEEVQICALRLEIA